MFSIHCDPLWSFSRSAVITEYKAKPTRKATRSEGDDLERGVLLARSSHGGEDVVGEVTGAEQGRGGEGRGRIFLIVDGFYSEDALRKKGKR